MSARFGRIPLNRIITEWEDGHPINPRMLAGEVAEVLRTLAPADHPIQEARASAILGAPTSGGSAVTFGALADYFYGAGQGRPAAVITTSAGPIPASHVFIWRQWLDDLAREATARAVLAAGFVMPANDNASAVAVANGSPTVRQVEPPQPPTGSEPGYLKMRQAQQRREGELSAAEQLEAKDIALQDALRRETAKDAIIVAKVAQVFQLQGELEDLRREGNEERRGRLAAEESVSEEREGRLEAEKRAEAAEAALAAAPAKVAEDFTDLGRSLYKAAAWFKSDTERQRKASTSPVLLVVAGLLELLLDRHRSTYNQGSAANAIAKKGWRAAGVRQVNGVFAEAKKAAKDARAEATAKAMDVQDSNVSLQD